jgi:hypothetical protein
MLSAHRPLLTLALMRSVVLDKERKGAIPAMNINLEKCLKKFNDELGHFNHN